METSEAKKIVDYKDAKIGKRQDTKTESIFISGSARDATLIVTTFFAKSLSTNLGAGKKFVDEEGLRKKWQEWQKFFYDQMTGQMPIEPECSTCGMKLKLSQKGDWYCSGYYDKSNLKHHPVEAETANEQKFLTGLK